MPLLSWSPFEKKLGDEQLFDVYKKFLAIALKNTFFQHLLFCILLSTSNNQGISCFHKAAIPIFVISIACALFSVD